MVFTSSEVLAAISMQKSRTHQHMYINVGFWIRNLDPQGLSDFGRSEKVADAHLHFRLERVCPESREVIVAASALDEAEQEQWYPQLIDLIRDTAAPSIRDLTSLPVLKRAFLLRLRDQGLVRKEAREYLSNP